MPLPYALRERARLGGKCQKAPWCHLRDLYVRELVKNGDVEVRYVKTNENIADFFTKFQLVATFRIHRDILMGICLVKRAWTSTSRLVRGDIYVATTSSSSPSARSEWEC